MVRLKNKSKELCLFVCLICIFMGCTSKKTVEENSMDEECVLGTEHIITKPEVSTLDSSQHYDDLMFETDSLWDSLQNLRDSIFDLGAYEDCDSSMEKDSSIKDSVQKLKTLQSLYLYERKKIMNNTDKYDCYEFLLDNICNGQILVLCSNFAKKKSGRKLQYQMLLDCGNNTRMPITIDESSIRLHYIDSRLIPTVVVEVRHKIIGNPSNVKVIELYKGNSIFHVFVPRTAIKYEWKIFIGAISPYFLFF